MDKQLPSTVDDYIAGCPAEIQPFLTELRAAVADAAPQAAEKISWGMATFSYHGDLVHFSAEKKHAGFHPTPSAIEAFCGELSEYVTSKGTVRLPYDRPLPLDLIRRMVRFRVEEQERLAAEKERGKKTERTPRPRFELPRDVSEALRAEELLERYEARPPYQRNDYLGWITRSKRPETRKKRLRQMLDELRAGNAYMGMAYAAKPKKELP